MKPRIRPRAAAALVAASGLILSGCVPPPYIPPSQYDPTAIGEAPQSLVFPSQDAEGPTEAERIEKAGRLAAGYDYAAATKLLAGAEGAAARDARAEIEAAEAGTVVWEDNSKISHLFVHSLIVDPRRAFDGDSRQQGYLDYMVTLDEFRKVVAELHRRGFVLVNPADIAAVDANGKLTYKDIRLLRGRKPLVLSEDDVSYYEYMEGDGFATRLLIDGDGKVKNEYEDAAGKKHIGAYDVAPVIDEFVEKNPDFSYRGAKGVLALTGYNGVLGYRTSTSEYADSKTLASDIEAATKVATALKEDGWVFASHTWGHINMAASPVQRIKRDLARWEAEVRPILGDTDQFVFPFGADISGVQKYTGDKYEMLRKAGFKFFHGIDGTTAAWMQKDADYLRQARINVDGLQFAKEERGDRPVLKNFFEVKKVIDPRRPTSK
ncbi:polysaccharide deacetylase family protein [Paeniglutamicibacter sp. ABSL32-1]|uniref:polysaccharide deacetylase family protein n=1 Tax=Paeniglutamicibacter quisquiliarum TaxID=2849498 RepID=UPI001C2CD08C|nr:polysaccharide deacetylase family protein [Paeniglutamicibacter quisquiliarum]MBV1778968.1 polysaccharide deacetylase family protein [Paeniglutamicibacter quisquiliarum]